MIVMRHEFVAEYPDRREYISSTLVDYGIPNGILVQTAVHSYEGDSSMSRTVSLPVGIAIRSVLEGRIKLTGTMKVSTLILRFATTYHSGTVRAHLGRIGETWNQIRGESGKS